MRNEAAFRFYPNMRLVLQRSGKGCLCRFGLYGTEIRSVEPSDAVQRIPGSKLKYIKLAFF
jgi:hypothetical protein